MRDHLRDRLSFEEILTLAERETGAYGVADNGLRERVSGFIGWINDRGPYTPEQVRAMSDQIKRVLATRLKLALDRRSHPAIAEVSIERPIFIIGFARTGTTVLHTLLAEDPEMLSLESWHMFSPSPPPGAGPVAAERIAYANRMVEAWMDFCPAQKPMHPYIDKLAHQPIEDEEAFSLDFHNAYPYQFYRVPVLEPGAVALGKDQVAGFSFHRTLLQHLQWNTGRRQWVCKGNTHPMNLEALLQVYPDALCIWTHRPPEEVYASNVALRSAIFDTIQGRPNDWSTQAKEVVLRMKDSVDRLLGNTLIDDPRILHVNFREIAADPMAVLRKIYAHHGLAVSPAFESRAKAWLASAENSADRFGRYPYSYDAFGLDRAWVEELFADYRKRFVPASL